MSLCGSVPCLKGTWVGLTREAERRGVGGCRLGLLPVPNWYNLQISQEALCSSLVRITSSQVVTSPLRFDVATSLHTPGSANAPLPSGRPSPSRDLTWSLFLCLYQVLFKIENHKANGIKGCLTTKSSAYLVTKIPPGSLLLLRD